MTAVDLAQALWLLVAALGLALSVSYARLPVLGQGAFVAVGGVGTALLGPGGLGWPLGVAALAAVAAAATAGYLVARGASRLQGAYLALATWALAWLVFRCMTAFPDVFGGEQGLVRPAPPRLVSPSLGLELVLTPTAHLVLAGGTCLIVILGLRRLASGPAGADLAALREDPQLAASLGVPVAQRRRAVVTVTAALGGLSGAGTAVLLGLVAPADVSPLLSLQLFVAVLVGATASWWGPVLGVALLTALPGVADAVVGGAGLAPERVRGVLTAGLLLAVIALRGPLARRLGSLRRLPSADDLRQIAPATRGKPATRRRSPQEERAPVLLRAAGITHAYGAVRALDGVDLEVRSGEVHALIGPNGSGKSTLLRVLSADLRPDAGEVEVAGVRQPPAGPADRVHAGVARTPQATVVLAGSTARQQVAIGARSTGARAAALRHLLRTPSSRATEATRAGVAAAALDATGLTAVADAAPATLRAGEQRLLQVARVVATGADVLLLDEPAAGMTAPERAQLAEVLRRLAGNGRGILLVEHDMRLVTAVADRVTVLERGRVLASGTPDAVRADPAVRRAYLGGATTEET